LKNFFSIAGYTAKDFLALSATALKIFSIVAYSAKKIPFLKNSFSIAGYSAKDFLALSATALKNLWHCSLQH
jgi:hypothetical protein